MGLFGKLFEKKECAFCGDEIGLLGNRKLEDGNMCKECANKLSPWFDERRHSTVEQIGAQLEYREANRDKVAAFNVTRTLGDDMKVMLDEDACLFMVTDARNLREANPDVLSFSDVTGCNLDIDEDRTEITYENSEGEEVSYRPPRYSYSYDFYMIIHVRNPYFDEIRFRLNDQSIEVDQPIARDTRAAASGFDQMMGGNMSRMMFDGMNRQFGGRPGLSGRAGEADFRYYEQMGQEIKEILLQARQQARDAVAAAAAPKAAITCPFCGATTTPDASGCCEFCGGAAGM